MIAAYVLMTRHRMGFSIRLAGEAPKAARFGGVNPARLILFSLGTGGALAGMAGLFEVAGPAGQISIDFNSGYGFTAIIVAFLGRLHPVGILLAGLLMALTYIGGELAQTHARHARGRDPAVPGDAAVLPAGDGRLRQLPGADRAQRGGPMTRPAQAPGLSGSAALGAVCWGAFAPKPPRYFRDRRNRRPRLLWSENTSGGLGGSAPHPNKSRAAQPPQFRKGRVMDLGQINPILLIASLMVASTPILLAALGEMVVEKAGVLNLGVEGMMITGAVVGFAVGVNTASPGLGFVAAAAAGAGLCLALCHPGAHT